MNQNINIINIQLTTKILIKKNLRYLREAKKLILFLLITTFFSCSKDDNNPIQENENYFLKVKIDGVDYSTNTHVAMTLTTPGSLFFHSIVSIDSFTEENAPTFTLHMLLDDPIVERTYITGYVEGVGVTTLTYTESIPWAATKGGSGTITITEINDIYIEGTFSFTGVNTTNNPNTTKVFTEGSFKAKKL